MSTPSEAPSAANVREGFEVEFECGHKAVYDIATPHGYPAIGEDGRCYSCDDSVELPKLGVWRKVVGIRQCWIETTTRVLFEEPKS